MLRTFGRLEVEGGAFRRPRGLLLLAYLAVEGPTARRTLARRFFPDATDPLKALGMTLTRLRAGLPGAVAADAAEARSLVSSDVALVRAALARGDHASAETLVRGPFLATADLRGCGEEVEEWLFRTREVLAAEVQEAFVAAAEHAAFEVDWPATRRAAAAAFELASTIQGGACVVPALRRRLRRLALAADWNVPEVTGDRPGDDGGGRDAARGELAALAGARSTTRLPALLDGSIGRASEEVAIRAALGRSRCATVTGMGGVGKSHLSLRVATHLAREGAFEGGVAWANLAPLDEGLVGPAVAAALEVQVPPGADAWAAVAAAVGGRRTLLLLDNAEHLGGLGPALEATLRRSSGLHLLVTSRVPLGLEGEAVVRLEGMRVPDAAASPEEALGTEAVQLFLARVAAGIDAVPVTGVEAIARICRALDGLPLAIELVAAWARVVAPDDVADAVERDLVLVADAPAVGRHATLRFALERSRDRLAAADVEALDALGVFEGGFDAAAARTVAHADLPTLARLGEASLLRPRPDGRFDQHPLALALARERIAATDAETSLRDRHAAYFLTGVAGGGHDEAAVPPAVAGDADLANLRSAWLHAAATDRLELLHAGVDRLERAFGRRPLELAALLGRAVERAVGPAPSVRHHELELRLRLAWAPTLMATRGYASPSVEANVRRARALAGDGPGAFPVLWGLWGYEVVRGSIREAAHVARAASRAAADGDTAWVVEAARMRAETDLWAGRFRRARVGYLGALPSLVGAGAFPAFLDGHHPGVTMRSMLGLTHWCLGDTEDAFASSRAAQALADEVGHPYGVAYATTIAAVLGCMARDHDWTAEHARAAEEVSTAHGFVHWAAVGRLLRGWVACQGVDPAAGVADLEGGLAAWRATGAGHSLPFFLALVAEVQTMRGLAHEAVTTLGEAVKLQRAQGERWWAPEVYRLRAEAYAALGAGARAARDRSTALELVRRSGALGWGRRSSRLPPGATEGPGPDGDSPVPSAAPS
jgi:predicted ATPase